ncbi:unnamed protein product, partial [Closterium sp. Naga37s-1]
DPSLWPVIPALPSYGRGREMPGPRYSSLLHCHNLTDVVITGACVRVQHTAVAQPDHRVLQLTACYGSPRATAHRVLQLTVCYSSPRATAVCCTTITSPTSLSPVRACVPPCMCDHGVIDGGGAAWWERKRGGVLQHSRGAVVEALWSSAVTVANVTLANAPAWALHPVYCTHVQVFNVTITAPPDSPNTIGIVIDSSEDVLIEGVTVTTGGGGISIKSGWDEYGLAFARPSHTVTIQHSHIQTPLAAALSIGSEMSGGVHSLRCRHLSVSHSRAAFHLRTAPGRGGYIRDVLVENVTMLNVTVALAFLPTCRSHPDDRFDPSALPRVANISFASISGSLISQAGSLIGLPAAPFKGVSLSDINLQLVEGGKGFKCQDVEGRARNVSPAICPELSPSEADPLKCRGCSSVRELHQR